MERPDASCLFKGVGVAACRQQIRVNCPGPMIDLIRSLPIKLSNLPRKLTGVITVKFSNAYDVANPRRNFNTTMTFCICLAIIKVIQSRVGFPLVWFRKDYPDLGLTNRIRKVINIVVKCSLLTIEYRIFFKTLISGLKTLLELHKVKVAMTRFLSVVSWVSNCQSCHVSSGCLPSF